MANTSFSIPADGVPQFDELHVISDLHLGGSPDFQIFNSTAELVSLIEYLQTRLPDKKVALLINGDLVDFLAESPAMCFDPTGAIEKLNRIAANDDSYFKPIFDALQKFVRAKNRKLIINLGNHDLELALPWVRARLLEILTGGQETASARIICAFDGMGFRCRVGSASVLCVHGNEVDVWNITDYETIRRFGREVTQGRPIDGWIPNAGAQLVIDVMNDLKRKYPFIDLLKPETRAAVPILLALAPDQYDKLSAISATVRRLAWDKVKRATGFLGSAEADLKGEMTAAADILSSRPNYFSKLDAARFDSRQYAKMLLDDAEERFNRGVSPMSLIGSGEIEEHLGLTSAVMKFFRSEDTSEVLREALSDLDEDRSFDPTAEDATFNLLDEQIGPGFDFIITGHTHLERALKRKTGGWYFNSGTWVRLIKLSDKALKDAEEFKKVFETFRQGRMQALDEHQNLVMRKLTVVVIRADGAKTHGELRRVNTLPTEELFPEHTEHRFTKE